MLGVAILYDFAEFARLADPYFRGVILAAAMIALVAFLDDIRNWRFAVKLAAQMLAALAAVGSGLYVHGGQRAVLRPGRPRAGSGLPRPSHGCCSRPTR